MSILMLLEEYDKEKGFFRRFIGDPSNIKNLRKKLKTQPETDEDIFEVLNFLLKKPMKFESKRYFHVLSFFARTFKPYPGLFFWQILKQKQDASFTVASIKKIKKIDVINTNEVYNSNEIFLKELHSSIKVYYDNLSFFEKIKQYFFGESEFCKKIRLLLLSNENSITYENVIIPVITEINPEENSSIKEFTKIFWHNYGNKNVPPAYKVRFQRALYYLHHKEIIQKGGYLNLDEFKKLFFESHENIINTISYVERLEAIDLLETKIWQSIKTYSFHANAYVSALELLAANKIKGTENVNFIFSENLYINDFLSAMQILDDHSLLNNKYFNIIKEHKNLINQQKISFEKIARFLVCLKNNNCLMQNNLDFTDQLDLNNDFVDTVMLLQDNGLLSPQIWHIIKNNSNIGACASIIQKLPNYMWHTYLATLLSDNFDQHDVDNLLTDLIQYSFFSYESKCHEKILAFISQNQDNLKKVISILSFLKHTNDLTERNINFIFAADKSWLLSDEFEKIFWLVPPDKKLGRFVSGIIAEAAKEELNSEEIRELILRKIEHYLKLSNRSFSDQHIQTDADFEEKESSSQQSISVRKPSYYTQTPANKPNIPTLHMRHNTEPNQEYLNKLYKEYKMSPNKKRIFDPSLPPLTPRDERSIGLQKNIFQK